MDKFSLPHHLNRLVEKIHVLHLSDENIGNMTVLLINDPKSEVASFAYSTGVGYFNEERGGYNNGLTYAISSSILIKGLFMNHQLITAGAQVEPEASYWTSQVSRGEVIMKIGGVWDKISNFKSESLDDNLVLMIRDE